MPSFSCYFFSTRRNKRAQSAVRPHITHCAHANHAVVTFFVTVSRITVAAPPRFATLVAIVACLSLQSTSSRQVLAQARDTNIQVAQAVDPDDATTRRARSAGRLDIVEAVRRSDPIALDGRITDPDWANAPVISNFTQSDPIEGAPPTERTEVRVVYDDDAIYVTARMFDSAPDSIVARLGRRDANLDSDHFVVFLDPYRDLKTGYYFGVNAAGTLYDGVLMNDDWDDESWDGVWEAKTTIDDEGWTAEFRIPYSQLRFYKSDEYTWGINFRRNIARKNEDLLLVYTPRSGSGFVSRFPELTGLRDITPRRQVEVLPYVTSRAEFIESVDGDPFNDGSRFTPDLGADFKVGLTSNLTLNGTVNPDFGQVEVDPAVVNLSDFETFFPEKRPFFIEGENIFSQFGRGGANNNWGFNFGNPQFFYSRRIGRAPQGSLTQNDYARVSDGTRILGAAKITGRVGDGWNVGMIQSVTGRSNADIQLNGTQSEIEVEPLAYYGIYRGQRELNDGRQAIGFLSTATARSFGDDRLRDQINASALAFAVDGYTFIGKNKDYVLTGFVGGSRVSGNETRMTRLQRGSLHYFDRPDSDNLELDTTATSLSGTAARFALNKQNGRVQFNAALGYLSPGFDISDVGFMFRTNIINGHVVVGYSWPDPGSWFRSRYHFLSFFNSADFDGNTTWRGVWLGNFVQLANYHSFDLRLAYNPQSVNTRLTRGGPVTLNQPGYEIGFEYDTDSRKPVVLEFGVNTYRQTDSDNVNYYTEAVVQPATNISFAIQPRLSFNNEFSQYVGTFDDELATATFGRRYVFANLEQKTVSASIRLNWTFTPALSLQLFAQPLISSGEYFNYKELKAPRTYDFLHYGDEGSTIDNETLLADPDGSGPVAALSLPDQDFNFRSLRGTAVARWEFRPGSTLYLVWTQSRSDAREFGDLRFGESFSDLVREEADNIFMVKVSWWLSR